MKPNNRTQAGWGQWAIALGETPRCLAPRPTTIGSNVSRSQVSGFFVSNSVKKPNNSHSTRKTERESMRKLMTLPLIGILAAACTAISGLVASAAFACTGEFMRFNASPEGNKEITHRVTCTVTRVKAVVETLASQLLGAICYVGRRPLVEIKFHRNSGFNDLTGFVERSETSLGRVGRRCVDGTKGGSHVNPVAVHGHSYA
jgi:hypothetical protein